MREEGKRRGAGRKGEAERDYYPKGRRKDERLFEVLKIQKGRFSPRIFLRTGLLAGGYRSVPTFWCGGYH